MHSANFFLVTSAVNVLGLWFWKQVLLAVVFTGLVTVLHRTQLHPARLRHHACPRHTSHHVARCDLQCFTVVAASFGSQAVLLVYASTSHQSLTLHGHTAPQHLSDPDSQVTLHLACAQLCTCTPTHHQVRSHLHVCFVDAWLSP